jgi:hypothetical protein
VSFKQPSLDNWHHIHLFKPARSFFKLIMANALRITFYHEKIFLMFERPQAANILGLCSAQTSLYDMSLLFPSLRKY